ncbi:MgtC/SapB family protein [Oscillospiraceae bacterium 38-13]
MLSLFDGLRDVTIWSVALRMTLAVICGGIIGIEREYKRRPAGFRTHILICLGAAMTTLTSQYLYLVLEQYTDMARLGAQVVAGIGFIGAGTIIVTRRQRVKGLTTAAGLWAAAIIGLALGGGFYEGGLFATALILIAELFFSRVEYRMLKNAPEVNLYIEYSDNRTMDVLLQEFREHGLKILNMGIIHSNSNEKHNACAIFTLRLHKGLDVEHLQQEIRATAGVVTVREL